MNGIEIGEKLKKLREDHAETQTQLAEAFGVSKMAVSQWESGNRIPSDEIKLKYASRYGVNVGTIFFNE